MTDGMLGIVPHKTSSKDFIKKGTIPTATFKAVEEQNMITWVIISSLSLGVTLLISLVVHPALVNAGLDTSIIVLIEGAIGIGCISLLTFVVAPWLNEVFAPNTSVKEVDPNAAPSGGQAPNEIAKPADAKSAMAIFGGGMVLASAFIARRKAAAPKKAEVAIEEPAHEELLSKIH